MCVIVKTRCFHNFAINSQSKLKKFRHNSKDIYEEKLVTKFNKLSWWALFTTAFWLETILDNVRDKSVKVNT